MKVYWRLVRNDVLNYPWHVECYPWAWGPLMKSRKAAVWGWVRHCIWPINRILNSWQHWRHCRNIIWVDCRWCNGCGIDSGCDCDHCDGKGRRMAINRGRVRRAELPNKMGTVWWV